MVFRDDNENGKRDAGEPGLAGVIVSDGLLVTRTDKGGCYTLAGVNRQNSRTVFVVTPSSYRNTSAFYQSLLGAARVWAMDFALSPDPERANPDFSFAQITDLHVTGPSRGRQLDQTTREIAKYHPAFALATGDLVDSGGGIGQMEAYEAAVRQAAVPIISLPGNHEFYGPGKLLDNFTTACAPTYYAFDYGGRHFVLLNSTAEIDRQYQWLKNDLSRQPRNKELLVFQHYPPDEKLMDLLSHYNTRAVFTGHWHASRVFQAGTILYVNAPPLMFAGIDMSPPTYKLVTFKDDKLTLTDIFTGVGPRQEWVDSIQRPLAAVDAPTPAPGEDWPMFQHDPARTGRTVDVVKPPLTLAWVSHLGGTIQFSSPVIAGHTMYIGLADEENRGRAGVYALDIATGERRWFYPTTSSVKHSVSVSHGTVYAATAEGDVLALDANSGKLQWSYSLGSPMDCWMFASPLVAGDTVYAGTSKRFVALDSSTGNPLWSDSELAGVWLAYHSSPVAGNGLIYVGLTAPDGLFALDSRTGKVRWRQKGLSSLHSTPTLDGDTLYSVSGGLAAASAKTGLQKWKTVINGDIASSPALAGDRLLVGTADGKLLAFDAASGKQLWQYSKPSPSKLSFSPYQAVSNPMIGSPAISGQIAYVGTAGGRFLAIDVKTGAELWHFDLGGPIASSAAISGNTVCVATYDGTVYTFVADVRD
jgi:outer membrane protein assembly factor BamB